MCAIAGIFNKNDESVGEEQIRRMLTTMRHRGPDAEGIFALKRVGLGHRRLSIIDRNESANQPMQHNQLIITYNGEIYNYVELRNELKMCGHHFKTRSDTEVILHAYEEWGTDTFSRFIGMWALAIYDQDKGHIILSRDRFGIKPLYYINMDRRFIFASEIKALLSIACSRNINYDVLLRYIVTGLEDVSNETFFKDIYQVQPGEMGIYDVTNSSWSLKRYYELSHATALLNMERYDELLKDAVRLQMRSDVPVGTCLSGGLDSSTVASLAARMTGKMGNGRFVAVTARAEYSSNDETPYAKKVAEYCNLDWHVTTPKYEDFKRDIEVCLYLHDEPVTGPSVYMQYCVMREAKACGIKVMLDGQGGDETLLGYERYYTYFLLDLIRKGYWKIIPREYLDAVKNSALTHTKLLSYIMYFLLPFIQKMVVSYRCSFLKHEYFECGVKNLTKHHFQIADMQISEIKKDQLPHLLRYEDRNSMAHSIEARVPFLDHRCVEAAIALTPAEKIKGGFTKYPLRVLAATLLPPEIAWRRDKMGFDAPEMYWLQKHSTQMNKAINSSPLLNKLCWDIPVMDSINLSIRWRLYNIALWERQHGVHI
ncbi:MAG: asparagine synthase (glutamine-hydrolyzing) [Deltaproteobacteria bacterium]